MEISSILSSTETILTPKFSTFSFILITGGEGGQEEGPWEVEGGGKRRDGHRRRAKRGDI